MVADKHKHAAYHKKHWLRAFSGVNIDDLEWPWMTLNPQSKGFSKFFAILGSTHISRVNCAEMVGDRPRQPPYKIFSNKCRF